MILAPRFVSRSERSRIRRSVWRTNLALAAVIGLSCWLLGWESFLLVEMPSAQLAGSIGVWLFLVQHQFEDAYRQISGQVPRLSLCDGMKCIKLKLWDEERRRLVTFRQARAGRAEKGQQSLINSPASRSRPHTSLAS